MAESGGPIIILGSQRSGTTAMSRLITKVLGYRGKGEGHLWPAVMMAWTELDSTVKRLGGVKSRPYRAFTIGHIGVRKIKRTLSSAMADIYENEFGSKWIDKTPGAQMIRSVPMLRDALPGVRFVFMRRRGIENVMSKQRRFPGRSFERCCEEWAETMSAWLDVRDGVRDQSIEIDQMTMAIAPDRTAAELCAFLGEGEEIEAAVRSYLSETRSEQTNPLSAGQTMSLADTKWDAEQVRTFCEKCAPMMAMYGYAFEARQTGGEEAPMSMPLTFTRTENVKVDSASGDTSFKWDGLRLVCLNGGGAENVRMEGIAVTGQNAFESSVKVGGRASDKTVTLVVTLQDSTAREESASLDLGGGAREELLLPLGRMESPLTITIRATASAADEGTTNITLLRPRLTYRSTDAEERGSPRIRA